MEEFYGLWGRTEEDPFDFAPCGDSGYPEGILEFLAERVLYVQKEDGRIPYGPIDIWGDEDDVSGCFDTGMEQIQVYLLPKDETPPPGYTKAVWVSHEEYFPEGWDG